MAMARIDWVEERLQRWAQKVTVGDGSGFPVMSVLHEDWMPPSPGITPSMKVSSGRNDAMSTHRAIGLLSKRLQDTIAVHYAMRLPMFEQAQRLGCAIDTVHGRIEAAHRLLASLFNPIEPVAGNRNNHEPD
jgi:DNA-directed RNA polymerase specialized sigma24 family protein